MASLSSFTVVSTFSGAGGSSLGYQLAGGKVLLAVEMDDNAVETYRLNFPDTPIYHGDISKLSVEKCLELASVEPGELDILDGSPPCQGFSTAGKRDFGDDRNQLFREFVRLLRGLRPKVFVMENVSGMVKGKMKLIFVECLRELKASGYKVKARVLNAMYYNVPQSRQRLIFVGVREDIGIEPGHPKAQTKPRGVEIDRNVPRSLYLTPSQFEKVDAHKRRHKAKGNGFGWQEVTSRKPSPAILKNMLIGGSNTRLVRSGNEYRYLSDNEIKRIGSYPLSFQFTDRKNLINRIGNSVPPNFMKEIAIFVRDNILSAGR